MLSNLFGWDQNNFDKSRPMIPQKRFKGDQRPFQVGFGDDYRYRMASTQMHIQQSALMQNKFSAQQFQNSIELTLSHIHKATALKAGGNPELYRT
jgi:hypothetical protein